MQYDISGLGPGKVKGNGRKTSEIQVKALQFSFTI